MREREHLKGVILPYHLSALAEHLRTVCGLLLGDSGGWRENFVALIVASVARGSIQRDRIDPFFTCILLWQWNPDHAILLDPSSSHFWHQPSGISYGSPPPFCFFPSFIMLFQERWREPLFKSVSFPTDLYDPVLTTTRCHSLNSLHPCYIMHILISYFVACAAEYKEMDLRFHTKKGKFVLCYFGF